jgi:hypothetical protein
LVLFYFISFSVAFVSRFPGHSVELAKIQHGYFTALGAPSPGWEVEKKAASLEACTLSLGALREKSIIVELKNARTG